MPAKKTDRSFEIKTKDLTVNVSGKAEQVNQVYTALQGALPSLVSGVLTNGGKYEFSAEGAEIEQAE